jgi:hypothetical protein
MEVTSTEPLVNNKVVSIRLYNNFNRILRKHEASLRKKIQDKYPHMTDDILDQYFGKDEWITGLKLDPTPVKGNRGRKKNTKDISKFKECKSLTEVNEYTLTKLKDICVRNGLSICGNKHTIASRVWDYLKKIDLERCAEKTHQT